MTTWYAEHAWVQGEVHAGVLLDVADGVIAATGRADAPPDGAEVLAGLTLPGLVDAHSHCFHRLLRGAVERPTESDDFWRWRDAMYHLSFRLDPDRYRLLARAVFAEMALAGITEVGEFHYVHHDRDGHRYDDPNEMGKALVAAAGDVGIRITLIDTAYLRSGFGDDPLSRFQLRFSDGTVGTWAERVAALVGEVSGPAVRVGAAAHSVRALRPSEIGAVADTADQLDLPLHFHLSEQPAENEGCLARFGRTPTQVMADAGALGPRATAIHATHLTDRDTALLGDSGAVVCMCPTTERELGDGIGRASELAEAGVPLALGSDSQAVIDLFEEARAVELHDRLRLGRRDIHEPASLFAAATSGGARALGRPEAGLEVGALADFISVDVDTVRLAGWRRSDGIAPVVFAAIAADVTDVVVAGTSIVTASSHRTLDVVATLREAIAAMEVGES